MTKNKKKLRRAERRYSVTKSAQTLVLAGALVLGGVAIQSTLLSSDAFAAAYTITGGNGGAGGTGDGSSAPGGGGSGGGGAGAVINSGTVNLPSDSLTITGGNGAADGANSGGAAPGTVGADSVNSLPAGWTNNAGTGGAAGTAGNAGNDGNASTAGSFAGGAAGAAGTGGNGGVGGGGGSAGLLLSGQGTSFTIDALTLTGGNGGNNTALGGDAILRVNGATLTVKGATLIGTTGTATRLGNSSLIVDGGTGKVVFENAVTIGHATLGAGLLQIGGDANGTTNTGAGTADIIAGKEISVLATGALNLGGAGSVGSNGGDGILNVHGTLTGTNGTLVFGGAGAAGNLGNAGNAGGIGTINIKNGGAATFAASQVIGGTGGDGSGTAGGVGGTGGDAILNIESGAGTVVFDTLTVGGTGGDVTTAISGGNGGAGTVNVNNTTQAFADTVTLGGAAGTGASANGGKGGKGTLNVHDGSTVALSNTTTGVQIGSTSAYGGAGELNVKSGGTVNSAGDILVGNTTQYAGNGTLQIDDGGSVVVATSKVVTIAGNGSDNFGKVSTQAFTKGNSGTALGLTSEKVNINSGGIFEVRSALNLSDGDDLAAAGKAINLATGGLLDVQGKLTLTEAAPLTSTWTGEARAKTFEVSNAGALQTFKLDSAGSLTLLGDGTANFLKATSVTLDKGATLNLGTAGPNAPESLGGTYTGVLTFGTSGTNTLNVAAGEWTLTNNSSALNLDANGKLTVNGGTLSLNLGTANLLTVGAANGLVVSGGNLDLTDSKGLKVTGANSFGVTKGNLTVASFDGTGASAVSTIGGSNSATMKVTSANAGDFKNVASKLKVDKLGNLYVQQGAVFNAGAKTINSTNVKTIDIAAGGIVYVEGTDIKSMTVTEMKTARDALRTTGNTGLVNFGSVQLSDITGGKAAYSDVQGLATEQLLETTVTGATGSLVDMNGAFKNIEVTGSIGDETLSVDGTLQLVGDTPTSQLVSGVKEGHKADMTVKTGSVLTLGKLDGPANGGGILSGDLTLNDSANTALNVISGNFTVGGNLAASGSSNNSAVAIEKGTLTVKGTIGAGSNTSNVNISNGGTLIGEGASALNTVNINGGTLKTVGDTSNLTIGSFQQKIDGANVNGKVSNASITAGGNMTVTNNGIDANSVNIQVLNGTLATGNNGSIAAAGKSYIEAKDVAINGTGTLALSGASELKVTDTLTAGGNITVGSNAENSTGKLSANVLALGANTLFVDPAWVNGQTTHETGYASQVAVKSFSAVEADASKITGNVIGGQASQITLGSTDLAWVQKKLDTYNSAHGTNIWGNGAGLVNAAMGIVSPFTVTTGSLVVNGTSTGAAGTAGTATFGANSLLIVDANSVGAANTALTTNGNITVAADAKLMVSNATVDSTYTVATAGGTLTIDPSSWTGANLLTDHKLLAGTLGMADTDKSATVTINQRSATSVLPGLSGEMGGLIDQMIKQNLTSENSPNRGVSFVNRAINRLNGDQAAATIEGAAQLAVVGAAPAMTLSAVQAGTSTVTTRTSFASPLMDSSKAVALHKDVDGTLSVDSGLNAGNGMKNGFGLWIMPLYQSNSAWGMKADGFKGGYKSDLGGVALGADYTFNDMFRLGLAFNIGGGYAESNGDFNKTENSFNFWGINAYGGWTMNNFGITADVGYTGNYNKLQQELPGSMGMGDIKSDVNSSAWTAGLRGEYKFATEALDIIPHVGVRYTGLTTDEYKAKSGGDTVFKVDQSFQSIWTFPIGVTLAKEIETGSGWIIRPQVDLGITPATGDVKAKSKVRIPGVDAQSEMKMQVVDYMSYDGGVGLEMKKDNVSFGINYNIQASEHRTGHGVFGTFRYEF